MGIVSVFSSKLNKKVVKIGLEIRMPTDVFPLLSDTELHYVVLLLFFHYLFFHICILT